MKQTNDIRGRIIVVKNSDEMRHVVKLLKEKVPEEAEPCTVKTEITHEQIRDEETVIIVALKRDWWNSNTHPVGHYHNKGKGYLEEGETFATLEIRIRTEEAHKRAEENTLQALWKKQFN